VISVRVPATSANLGPGYDAVGLALTLGTRIALDRASHPKVEVTGTGSDLVPLGPDHPAYRAARFVAEVVGEGEVSFHLVQENDIPPIRGLGGSAAALVGGAVAAPLAVVMGIWLLVLPPLGEVTGSLSGLTRHSALARSIDAALPEPPEASQALRRLAGPGGAPHVFNGLIPALETGPPPREPGLGPQAVARVSASTVKVEGVACRFERDGSGFAVAPDLVVTNAHVVAGQRRTTVVRPDGRRLAAEVTVFDPARDLALLEVPGLGQAPLPLATGKVGSTAAVFGHPDGQIALEISPAAIRQQVNALGRDLYELGVTRRAVYVLAADLAPGDSGGALVDADGQVVGVAFAISRENAGTAYALAVSELRDVLAAERKAPASTGPCLG